MQAPASKRGDTLEVLQHTQYCHLVPAPGLRTAYDNLLDGSFEDMLREVRRAWEQGPGFSLAQSRHALCLKLRVVTVQCLVQYSRV